MQREGHLVSMGKAGGFDKDIYGGMDIDGYDTEIGVGEVDEDTTTNIQDDRAKHLASYTGSKG